jgi:hypothetical protein
MSADLEGECLVKDAGEGPNDVTGASATSLEVYGARTGSLEV